MDTTELPRLPCPFDGSAHARQIRMGLLNSLGVPDQDVIAVLSRVHAAMFYDRLWDIFEDGEQVRERPAGEIKLLRAEIHQIGNNINQIARSVNMGIANPEDARNGLMMLEKVYDLMYRIGRK